MGAAAEQFFGCTENDMAEYRAEQERNRPVDPKTLIKQQFVMSKSEAKPGKLLRLIKIQITESIIFVFHVSYACSRKACGRGDW